MACRFDPGRGYRYAREGLRFAWLVAPGAQRLEGYVLGEDGHWKLATIFEGAARVGAVPFDATELDLWLLWAK